MLWNAQLRKLLKDVNIEKAFNVDFGSATNRNTFCPFHEDPDNSSSKSCSISIDGLFNCRGCNTQGDIFDFVAKRDGMTREEAVELLKGEDYQAPSPSHRQRKRKRELRPEMVTECLTRLHTRKDFISFLKIERGLTLKTIADFKIGCDEHRITIPVYGEDLQLCNMRRYNPRSKPKMVSFSEGYGKVELFPFNHLDQEMERILLCEGEWDCILLQQLGYNAITTTGGVSAWDNDFNQYFVDKEVYIIYDVHDKGNLGQMMAQSRAATLTQIGAKCSIVQLDLPTTYIGGDITDYFIKEKHTIDEFTSLLENAPAYALDPTKCDTDALVTLEPDHLSESNAQVVSLSAASHSRYYFKKIQMRCLVAGKGSAPYLPPRTIRLELIREGGDCEVIEHTFNAWEGAVLSLIQCSTRQLHAFLRAWFNIPRKAEMKAKILNTFNIEQIFLIPSIDLSRDQGPYVIRKCYYIGHGIQSNKVYDFTGYTLPDPADQSSTHILTHAEPAETDIDMFTLSEEDIIELRETFQSTNIESKMLDISGQMAEHITKIYGRDDLHIAIDLVYHSPLIFEFDRTMLKKGWLEILVLGDTRTGKGFVTENLAAHYRAGEVVSGENVSVAGLIGGVQHLGDKWTLVWGKLPLADRRLIILDEASSLSYTDISKLSRIRSEGVAEITKIVSEKTTARTRLIWLANPRPKQNDITRTLADYNYGIESVPELVGATEDIARFDFVLNVGHNDVSSDIINSSHREQGTLKYTQDLCHKLVMWVWSRKPEQVVFEKGVVEYTMQLSKEIANQFTSKIPLIQIEDVRFKLARIGAAIAGRVFSTYDGTILVVKKEHVQYAYNYLVEIYSKPVCGYAQLSSVDQERRTLADTDAIYNILTDAGEHYHSLISGLLEHRQLRAQDLCDYANLDLYQARAIMSELVRLRAIIKEYSWYVKKPAFKTYLRKLKMPNENLVEV